MSGADEKQTLPIALSGAIGVLAIADAFLITSDSDDMFKILLGIGSIAVSALLLFSGGNSMSSFPFVGKEEEPEEEPEPKF
jgi:multisubunit Na+/H+ antiporter MnhC subunit